MNRDKKRFRQISIAESFSRCKKSRSHSQTSTMEQNLRDLMAAAAEKRASSDSKKQNGETSASGFDSPRASTSRHMFEEERQEVPDPEEMYIPSSEELFPDSEELFSTQPDIQDPSSPENNFDAAEAVADMHLSAEIFPDSTDVESETVLEYESNSEEEENQISFLNRTPRCCMPLPKLEPLENHAIMFSPHIRPGDAPRPYPSSYRDKWDSGHVRMPCSPLSKYPVEDVTGDKQIRSRWNLICYSLKRNIETSYQLEEAIMRYNAQYREKWNFNSLHAFFNLYCSVDEQLHFFETILPPMIKMALDLPNICTQPPPLLRKDKDYYVTMSQKQIACLVLNAFFCTFPRRNLYTRYRRDNYKHEYSSFPDINFNRLFFGVKNRISQSNAEKLKCLIHYFTRITSEEPLGTITFHRQYLEDIPNWDDSVRGIKTAVVKSKGLIETEGDGMLQVDFANKFVGGGVLGHGCVQEEIRFVICPELIVSRLFVECLGPTEVLIVTGVEQYSKYSGYSDTFKWEGNFCDQTPRDSWGRRYTQLVAMNATSFRVSSEQFKPFYIERELNKAFCGFYEDAYPTNLSAVATGNWGCGAFKGSSTLKFIIQVMAASQAGRDLLYFTFGNKSLKSELRDIYNLLSDKNLSVGDVWRILMRYSTISRTKKQSLYDFLHCIFSDQTQTNTEETMCNDTSAISDNDQQALEKLIEDINNDSDTEIEDNVDAIVNDPG